MRKYENQKENRIQEVYCNGCGKKLLTDKGMVMEGVFHGQVQWGFFSQKDGETHSFDLCEKCYDLPAVKQAVDRMYKGKKHKSNEA